MDSPAWMFTKALSHRQKVCRLYKRACRELDSWLAGVVALDPFGSSFDRERESPDELCDHPGYQFAEREQFPYYFNRREQRKKEILEHWQKIEKAWDEEIEALQKDLPEETQAQATK